MLEVMKMLQKIHLDKISIYYIYGRNTFRVKYFQTLASIR